MSITRVKGMHLVFSLCLILFALVGQSYFLALSTWNLVKVDFVTLIMIYSCFEYSLPQVFVRIVVASFCYELMSAAPAGFFGTYYFLCLGFVWFLSKNVIVHKKRNQLWMVFLLLGIKYALVYLTAVRETNASQLLAFLEVVGPQWLVTTAMVIPVFCALSKMDSWFVSMRYFRSRGGFE